MKLQNIQEIVNSGRENWRNELLQEIAKDKKAIPYIMEILAHEREENGQLITDLNFQLSRAHTAIRFPNLNKDNFIDKEITDFYKEGRIRHCFANMD